MKCDAPTCEREAVVSASGTDYAGEAFVDLPLCESCAEYIAEAGQERVTFTEVGVRDLAQAIISGHAFTDADAVRVARAFLQQHEEEAK